jgi:SAM-dependent methyltransferase
MLAAVISFRAAMRLSSDSPRHRRGGGRWSCRSGKGVPAFGGCWRKLVSMSHEDMWDVRYAESDRIWSGEPNAALVDEVTGLPPGRALDLGCGEGADAVWLAREGWTVTAADISTVALGRAAMHAEAAGVTVEFQHHDLSESFPQGSFDLVSAQFLHFWEDFDRDKILRRAADAVAPGGILLIEGHMDHGPFRSHGQAAAEEGQPAPESAEHGHRHGHDGDHREGRSQGPHAPGEDSEQSHGPHGAGGHAHPHFPAPDEVIAALDLADGWEVLRAEVHPRTQTGPDGNPAVRTDCTVKLRRRPAAA